MPLPADLPVQVGEDLPEEPRFRPEPVGGGAPAPAEGSRSSSVTRGAALLRISWRFSPDRRADGGGHLEAEPARELAGPHHPDGVLAEADLGVADRPDEVLLEVVDAADVVDHGEVAMS